MLLRLVLLARVGLRERLAALFVARILFPLGVLVDILVPAARLRFPAYVLVTDALRTLAVFHPAHERDAFEEESNHFCGNRLLRLLTRELEPPAPSVFLHQLVHGKVVTAGRVLGLLRRQLFLALTPRLVVQ